MVSLFPSQECVAPGLQGTSRHLDGSLKLWVWVARWTQGREALAGSLTPTPQGRMLRGQSPGQTLSGRTHPQVPVLGP